MTSPPQNTIQAALLKELGFERFSPENRQKALAAIGGPILQSVTLAVMTKLPDEATRQEFQKALTAGDSAGVEKLITAHIESPSVFIEAAVRTAVEEFKALRGAQN